MDLAFCFVSTLKAGTIVTAHAHDTLEIVYYTRGEGEITLDP